MVKNCRGNGKLKLNSKDPGNVWRKQMECKIQKGNKGYIKAYNRFVQ